MEVDPNLLLLTDENQFNYLQPVEICCNECGAANKYSSPVHDQEPESNTMCTLICSHCKRAINIASAIVQLINSYRSLIHEYYASGYQCNDASCDHQTMLPSDPTGACPRIGCNGKLIREVTYQVFVQI